MINDNNGVPDYARMLHWNILYINMMYEVKFEVVQQYFCLHNNAVVIANNTSASYQWQH